MEVSRPKINGLANAPPRVIEAIKHATSGDPWFVERVPGCLNQVFMIAGSDGMRRMIKCRPAETVRLLRHERNALEVEVAVLRLGGTLSFVPPVVVSYSVPGQSRDPPPYLLRRLGSSLPVRNVKQMMPDERYLVQRSIFLWIMSTSSIKGQAFGPLYLSVRGQTFPDWPTAFINMMTSVLQDAADLMINVPFNKVMLYVQRLTPQLSKVTTPKLVLLDVLKTDNIIVDPVSHAVTGLVECWNAVWGDPDLALCGLADRYDRDVGSSLLPRGDADAIDRRALYVNPPCPRYESGTMIADRRAIGTLSIVRYLTLSLTIIDQMTKWTTWMPAAYSLGP